MLNAIDQVKIKTLLSAFVGKETLNIDPLLIQWSEGKKDIFDLLGGLTIEKQFSGELTDDAVRQLFQQFRYENDYFGYHVNNFMSELTGEEIKSNKCIKHRSYMEGYKIGQKLSKYLNTIIEDVPNFREIKEKFKSKREYFSIKFSMFLQSLKFEGIMVISIDPLDYLTMSLNQAGWHSCHDQNGCHRAGMLAYMVDKHSVIMYVKSIKDVEYELNGVKFVHNSKKWRQVSYVDIDTLSTIFSRQYPADNENACKVAREMMSGQFSKFMGIEDKCTITDNNDRIYDMVKDYDRESHEYILHYNDILNIRRRYFRLKMSQGGSDPNIVIGKVPYCPECGDRKLDYPSLLLCKKCRGDLHICPDCGEEINGRGNYGNDDHYYCNSCFSANFSQCRDCGEYVRLDSGRRLDSRSGRFICNSCIERDYIPCERCGDTIRETDSYTTIRGVNYCRVCYIEIRNESENREVSA